MDFADRTVLVVGGAGYVGSVLVTRLLDAGASVRVLDQLIYDNGSALAHLLDNPRLQFKRGDLRERHDLDQVAYGATDLVLLASLVGDPICQKYPELARDVNENGAKRLIDRIDEWGMQHCVFTSTCSNYGIHQSTSLATESSELNPQSLYARTKIAVEEHVLQTSAQREACTTVLRIATAYGLSPRMRFDLTVSQFTRALASGEPLQVYDADTWRPYCHVRDIAKAIMAVLTAPAEQVRGEVFNVGDTGQQFTKRMIVDEVQKHLPDISVEYREGDTDPRNYRVSFEKITERLGFHVDHTVQNYVAMLAAAVQEGIFAGGDGDSGFGNYEVRHLELPTDRTPAAPAPAIR